MSKYFPLPKICGACGNDLVFEVKSLWLVGICGECDEKSYYQLEDLRIEESKID